MAPFGYDQHGRPYSDKQKLIAGPAADPRRWLGHRTVLHRTRRHRHRAARRHAGDLRHRRSMGLIDGILILVNGGTDAQGRPLREN
jgi:hypothetical protein